MTPSFYWHDYETWGADPRRDRAAQFAGIRTDWDLNVVGKPLVAYCRPGDDMLPHPEACLITGITPQQAWDVGVIEAEFFRLIHEQLARPGTCGVGYNSMRFDDEFTRYGFYRNFIDPYAREWMNGNSRWDIIDMARLAHAVRPEGIEWPQDAEGTVSFRLDRLTVANGISHEGAHDALSDVYATLDLARLIKQKQPRLFDYLLRMRDKRRVGEMLNPATMQPVLHVSSKYPARQGCIAMVAPLARHPTNSNGIIVYDLRYDPGPLIELDVEEIRQRLFTPVADLPTNVARIPLKTVHLNKAPVVVPLSTLNGSAADRWGINVAAGQVALKRLKQSTGLAEKVRSVHQVMEPPGDPDPDANLYGGGFFSNGDRHRIARVRESSPELLGKLNLVFDDQRLPELLFRFRARNWPEYLTEDERERWQSFRLKRVTDPEAGGGMILDVYRRKLARLMVAPLLSGRDREILSKLADWPERLHLT
ncbi:MAG: exodeoxyribonuclease I [Gammaproteobacteria bacterium]|nr:exodeoxyribonuclease I [Gammaproteobacteria bacterium]